MGETQLFPPEQLFEFSVRVFEHFGVPEDDARTAATVLQAADLRGIDSHGVARLHTYFDMLQLGRIDPKPSVTIVRESASTATVDGGNGLGLVVGPKANAIAMEKAMAVGSGWVSVRNTNHYGIAGYYVLEALKRDLIGWSMTNATTSPCAFERTASSGSGTSQVESSRTPISPPSATTRQPAALKKSSGRSLS